jgi:hypothetical protein
LIGGKTLTGQSEITSFNKMEEETESAEVGQKQCFEVKLPNGYVPDFNTNHDNAEEYLRRVNYEAKMLPDTIISDVRQTSFESKVTYELEIEQVVLHQFDESHALHPDYITDLLIHFNRLRQKIVGIREEANISTVNSEIKKFKKQTKKWKQFCYEDEMNPSFPEVSKLIPLDYVHTNQLFHHACIWIKQDGKFNKLQSNWIYSILALIEDPIQCNTVSDMNDLVMWLFKTFDSFTEDEKTNASIILTLLLSYFKIMQE